MTTGYGADTGVCAFFLLSGYLITGILHRSRIAIEGGEVSIAGALSDFWQKRALRLFPLYFLALACTAAIAPLLGHGELLVDLPWYLVYLQNYRIWLNDSWGLFGHTWTLAIENQFYVLFSLTLLLVPARFHARTICALLFMSAVALWAMSSATAFWVLPPRAMLFLGAAACLRSPGTGCRPRRVVRFPPYSLSRRSAGTCWARRFGPIL
jgi:peptidoglycan/LPS O-acetylase OafA/YrhL